MTKIKVYIVSGVEYITNPNGMYALYIKQDMLRESSKITNKQLLEGNYETRYRTYETICLV